MNGKMLDLGWAFAKYNDSKHYGPKLTIVSPSDNSETFHTPAESVTIWGDVTLAALRDFLIDVLPKKEEVKT